MTVLTQVWRVVRVFLLAFVAQLIAYGADPSHLTEQVLIAAGVAAAEATYRQVVPAGKTDGALANLLAAYKLIQGAKAASKAAPAAPEKTA